MKTNFRRHCGTVELITVTRRIRLKFNDFGDSKPETKLSKVIYLQHNVLLYGSQKKIMSKTHYYFYLYPNNVTCD